MPQLSRFIKYNRTLMCCYNDHTTIDLILLDSIDDADEFLSRAPSNQEDRVYKGEFLTYGHVAMESSVDDNNYDLRRSNLRGKERVLIG